VRNTLEQSRTTSGYVAITGFMYTAAEKFEDIPGDGGLAVCLTDDHALREERSVCLRGATRGEGPRIPDSVPSNAQAAVPNMGVPGVILCS
jgi:hypothetical protein